MGANSSEVGILVIEYLTQWTQAHALYGCYPLTNWRQRSADVGCADLFFCYVTIQVFIEELLEVMPDYLGPNLDYEAWNHCLHVITAGIKS